MNKLTPFQQALLDATLEDYAHIPENDTEINPSPEFSAKMKKLIRKADSRLWHFVNTTTKRIALFVLILVLLTTTALAIPAIKNAFISFFYHDRGTHYEFTLDPAQAATAPDQIETAYAPNYIPDGFSVSFDTVNISAVSIIWNSENGSWISFLQLPMPDDCENDTIGGINAEGVTLQKKEWNGYEVLCIDDEGAYIYVWTNHAYIFTLICEDAVSAEETRKIFDSIQPMKDAVILGAE